jgi:hypothetical protein
MIGDEIPQVGLPFMSFMAIGCVGLAEGQKAKFKELERQKRYVEPEKAEDILAVRVSRGCEKPSLHLA